MVIICHSATVAQHQRLGIKDTIENIESTNEEEDGIPDDEEEAANTFTNIHAYAPDSIYWRKVPDAYINTLKKDKDFDYVEKGLRSNTTKNSQTINNNKYQFQEIFLYIAIVIFIACLAWYLINNKLVLFKRKSKPINTTQDITEEKDIFTIPYDDAIAQALSQKNFRLAIRLQYLQLLKKMAEKNLIHYLPDKTNFDYLVQVRPTNYYTHFFTVTRNYEYSWYGQFDITENMYQKIDKDFAHFKQQLQF